MQAWQVFLIFLKLGATSFGGPMAHLGFYREEFVRRRQWLDEQHYADIVALCQFLPGAASSQVGMAIGLGRAGLAGALAAWVGFTLPSAVLMILLGIGLKTYAAWVPVGAVHGLKLVTVAVVAQAMWGMARNFCTDAMRIALALAVTVALLGVPGQWTALGVLLLAGLIGALAIKPPPDTQHVPLPARISRRMALLLLMIGVALLAALPIAAQLTASPTLAMVDAFYRIGALVFGGGHVVLPMLQAATVQLGWIGNDQFLAGYGLTQAMPGPLFTFSAFLGAAMQVGPGGAIGGVLALLALFLPSGLLVCAAMPFWAQLGGHRPTRAALAGVNAAVVGLLLAALVRPVASDALHNGIDVLLAVFAYLALNRRVPPWLVVIGGAVAGAALSLL
ncbi:MAG: chromate efflux transporter [Burkholderiales bacterium]|nr:chromate efflux transporter [Burkholderiales bacterium]